MGKFSCEYENGKELEIDVYKLVINASDHNDAYTQFIKKIGIHRKRVFVQKGFWFDGGQFFDCHITINKKEETENKDQSLRVNPVQRLYNTLQKESGSAVRENQIDNLTEESMEQLLMNLLRGQQTQINELKKLNFKLMMFWIFLVVLPLLVVSVKQSVTY